MRWGVIADVHGNLHALQAALAALRSAGVERYICAGDLVGYGSLPNECVRAVAELEPICVAGNHDLMVLGRLPEHGAAALVRESLQWTRERLADDVVAYLAALPSTATAGDGIVVAHGSLDDPRTYVSDRRRANEQLQRLPAFGEEAWLLLLGHTHRPLACRRKGDATGRLRGRSVALTPGTLFLLNPGSVGQSRELRVRARCMILDLERRRAEFLVTDYDVRACREHLSRTGLPRRSYHLPPTPLSAARALKGRLHMALRRARS